MAREFVLNPESGKAAVAVTTFQDVERTDLENAVNAKQAELDQVTAEHEAISARKTQVETELEDTKSELSGHDAVAPVEAGVDAGSDGSGSEGETVEAEPQFA